MIELRDLLERYGSLVEKGELKREAIQRAIMETTGLHIATKDISMQNGTVYLDTKSIYKNDIFLKREAILKKIDDVLGARAPKNIR